MLARKFRWKSVLSVIGSLGLSCALIYSISRESSFKELTEKFFQVDSKLLSFYICLSLAGLFLRALRYLVCYKAIHDSNTEVADIDKAQKGETAQIQFKEMLITTGVRNGFVDFLPARLGELSYFFILKRYGLPLATLTTIFGICTALDIVVLFLILFFGAIIQLFADSVELISLGVAPLFLALAFILLYLAKYIDKPIRFTNRLPLPDKLKAFLNKVADEVVKARRSGKYWLLILISTLLRVAKYGSLYILLLSVVKQMGFSSNEVSLVSSTLAFIAAEASASLPISGIMGFGAYEGAWQMIFSTSGIKISSLSSVIFVVHIISQVVGYFIALCCLGVFTIQQLRLSKS